MSYTILTINPGSTSTKVALFDDKVERCRENIEHPSEEIKQYASIYDQLPMRYEKVLDFLKKNNVAVSDLDCVVSRGGMVPPVQSGAYGINDNMVDCLLNRPYLLHASNLGALIADKMVKGTGIPAYIYDPIPVDELDDIARITGAKEIKRISLNHTLNTRAMCVRYAEEHGKKLSDLTIITAHMGGGISLNLRHKDRMIESIGAEDGPFSSERAGGLPIPQLLKYVKEHGYDAAMALERGKGGLASYCGTNSAIEVTERIEKGDKEAELVFKAMAYQVAMYIGHLAPVVNGKVDAIILTGGMAHSKLLTGWITERVSFIAPVVVYAGENEMQSLANGGYRVITGEETARVFDL